MQIVFWICSFGQATDQTETLFVTPFGVEQGLRQSMVTRVIQDSNGLIWLTTGDGLHCFDGKEFRVFRVPVDAVYSHSDNLMRDMIEGNPGILTTSSSSSLLQFNTSTGTFSIVFRKNGSHPVLLDQMIDHRPVAWIHGIGPQLVGTDSLLPLKLIFEKNNELPAGFLPKHAVIDKSGKFLISGDDGILVLDTDNRMNESTIPARWIPVSGCQAIARDRTGRVFILACGKIYQYSDRRVQQVFFDTRITSQMSLFIDSKDNFWLTSTENGRQYKLSNGIMTELRICFREGKYIDSISPGIKSVFEDDHFNLWFGTDNNGVLFYSPGKVEFQRKDIGFTRCITWFNHEIWAGTYNDGLWRLSPDLKKATRIHSDPENKRIYYLDLMAGQKERLWVATRQGLEVLDKEGRVLFRHPFSCKNAKLVLQSADTVILFSDDRLYRYFSGDKIRIINSVPFVVVLSFLDKADTWWFGNQFGLFRSKKALGLDKNLVFIPGHQLYSLAVNSLLEHEGSIWAATGNGIEIFDLDGKKKPLPAGMKELQNEVIYALLPDNQGQVWFTGNHGIGCVNAKNDHIIYFTAENNLQSLEFNGNAKSGSPDGHLYFGGIRGINGFDPAWFNLGKKDKELRLISLFVSDTAFTGGIPPVDPAINLDRHSPHISGKIFCSDYTNSGLQLFSFCLEGYQHEWSKLSHNAEFSYRDLPPGKYRLMAKCADPWQNWSDPVVLLTITLNPPFWKTGWFLFALIFLIALITALIVKKINSMRYLRRIFILEQQNAVARERLRISKDMHDDLGASLTRISILSELAKKQQDDAVRSQQIIEQISTISGSVVDDLSEIIWAMNPRNDTFDSFTAYIREYVSSYLEPAGIEGHFQFPRDPLPRKMSSELRRNLFLTVKEALHNTVKHAGAGNVFMQMVLDSTILRIIISDDGKGFVTDKIQGWGNGLINMRKRIEENGGRFEIISDPGKGTKIDLSVNLPLN